MEWLDRHRDLVRNLHAVTVVKIVTLILPFLTYSYLFRTIGAERIGEIVFVLSVTAFFRVAINFGFEISAVRAIVCMATNEEKNRYALSVLVAQFGIGVVGAFALILLGKITGKLHTGWNLYLPAYLLVIGDVLALNWYFEGMLKMKYTAARSVIFEGATFLLTVSLVNKAQDYQYFLYLKMLSSWLGVCVVLYVVFAIFEFKIVRLKLEEVKNSILDAKLLFVSRMFAVLHGEIATILIGSYLTLKDVGLFDLARKILAVSLLPNSVINTVIFPYNSTTKNKKFMRKVFFLRNILATMIIAVIVLFSEELVKIISSQTPAPAVYYSQLISALILIRSIDYYIGISVLVACGHDREFNKSVIYTTMLYITIAILLVYFEAITVTNLILVMILTESFDAGYRYFYCKKYKLL